MTSPPSHRLRFSIGLALAAGLAVSACSWLLNGSRAGDRRFRAERKAVVTLRALTDAVEKSGGSGDPVRSVVTRAAAAHPHLKSVRVVAFEGLSLEASTASDDTGERAAPRRLAREEKSLYDQGQRLRAAVETNQREGAARKDEIEIGPDPAGGLALAGPVERDGQVVGLVQIVTAAEESPPPRAALLPALLAFLVPLVVFIPLSSAVGERRIVLAGLAVILLLGALAGYSRYAARLLGADRTETETAVADRVREEAARAAGALGGPGGAAAAPIDPASWDADRYRHPRGIVSASGSVDAHELERAVMALTARWTKAASALAAVSMALLVFVGAGGAARLLSTLRTYRSAYAYTFPAMLGMVLLVFFPFLYGIVLSFTDQTLYTTDKPITEIWVGIKNFADILGDFSVASHTTEGWVFNYQNFYWTLFVTVVWTITNVSIGVGLGLFLALILNTRGLAIRPVYRVLLILPWALPNYITALIWKGMFHQQFGVVNQVIQMFGGSPISWFERPLTSLVACIATNGWLSFPFMMVISLGALQSIPADLYEAARVDGASRWQQFRSITLPSLKPALVPAVILSVIWTFNMFNIIYLVSAGDPAHSTEILITQAYKLAFEQYRYGYAAAYSTVIFAILLIYGTWQNRVTRATEGL